MTLSCLNLRLFTGTQTPKSPYSLWTYLPINIVIKPKHCAAGCVLLHTPILQDVFKRRKLLSIIVLHCRISYMRELVKRDSINLSHQIEISSISKASRFIFGFWLFQPIIYGVNVILMLAMLWPKRWIALQLFSQRSKFNGVFCFDLAFAISTNWFHSVSYRFNTIDSKSSNFTRKSFYIFNRMMLNSGFFRKSIHWAFL